MIVRQIWESNNKAMMRGNGSRFKCLLKARETWRIMCIRGSIKESGKLKIG